MSREETDMLGRYNAERSRGLVHTPEWQQQMADLQSRFDEEMKTRYIAAKDHPPVWLGPSMQIRRTTWWDRLRHRLRRPEFRLTSLPVPPPVPSNQPADGSPPDYDG